MSLFDHVKTFPPDPLFGIGALYRSDARPDKVDLTIGVYRNDALKVAVMKAVKQAERLLVEKETTKSYLPQVGKANFIEESKTLLFGDRFVADHGERIFGAQSVGGTGALRVGAEFLAREISKRVFLSNLTWANHHGVFSCCNIEKGKYPYYDKEKGAFLCDQFLDFLGTLPEKSVVVLHTCCHNPTGCDPTREEWKAIEKTIAKQKLIPFFDTAYLGFAKSLEEDSWAVRYFAEQGHELFVALSFSKSFSLYAERIGAFFILAQGKEESARVGSVVKRLIRINYSNPPLHGAAVVSAILQDKTLRKMWEEELVEMRQRVELMRTSFLDEVAAQLGSDAFEYLRKRVGMFALLPLTEGQVEHLMNKRGIYMTKNGRINLTGLNATNLNRVTQAIVETCKEG
ncbi:MAG: aromatic amino acid transaminase [Chlamydiota bacterium]